METVLLDRYQILESLESGSLEDTFVAIDLHSPTQKKVLVKAFRVIHDQTTQEIIETLFLKEAAVLEELGSNCTQIPCLYAYFYHDNQYYLVQEYIEGKNLLQLDVIDNNQCFTILCSLLNTLKYIHSQNIIHRDIKPENIIIPASDGLPVLINFGAVKETMGSFITSTSSILSSVETGNRGFIPPEQNKGVTVFSSDLYALAWTMIYSLTGKLPVELSINHITGERDWQSIIPDLDNNLKIVLEKATSLDIKNRYPTAEAMYQELNMTVLKTVVVTPSRKANINLVTENDENEEEVYVAEMLFDSEEATTYAHKSNWKAIVFMVFLIILGVTGGLVIGQQISENKIKIAQIEQEKAQIEARLVEEQRKRKEAEKQRIRAEKLRQQAEKAKAKAEKLRREAEREAKKKLEISNIVVTPNKNIDTNKYAFIGGLSGRKNIRSGPGINYSIVANGYTGDRIEIIAQEVGMEGYLWYNIYHPESQTNGWIASHLVEF